MASIIQFLQQMRDEFGMEDGRSGMYSKTTGRNKEAGKVSETPR